MSLNACGEEEPVPQDKMIKIYVDLLAAQDTLADKSISTDSLRLFVLSKHGVSDSDYKQTVKYYNENPERWEDFLNKAIEYVEKLKAESEAEEKKLKEEADN